MNRLLLSATGLLFLGNGCNPVHTEPPAFPARGAGSVEKHRVTTPKKRPVLEKNTGGGDGIKLRPVSDPDEQALPGGDNRRNSVRFYSTLGYFPDVRQFPMPGDLDGLKNDLVKTQAELEKREWGIRMRVYAMQISYSEEWRDYRRREDAYLSALERRIAVLEREIKERERSQRNVPQQTDGAATPTEGKGQEEATEPNND